MRRMRRTPGRSLERRAEGTSRRPTLPTLRARVGVPDRPHPRYRVNRAQGARVYGTSGGVAKLTTGRSPRTLKKRATQRHGVQQPNRTKSVPLPAISPHVYAYGRRPRMEIGTSQLNWSVAVVALQFKTVSIQRPYALGRRLAVGCIRCIRQELIDRMVKQRSVGKRLERFLQLVCVSRQ